MIFDYQYEPARLWYDEAIKRPEYIDFIHGLRERTGEPVLTQWGKIKKSSYAFRFNFSTDVEYCDFLSWCHFEAGFVGYFCIMNEVRAYRLRGVTLAVMADHDANAVKVRWAGKKALRYDATV